MDFLLLYAFVLADIDHLYSDISMHRNADPFSDRMQQKAMEDIIRDCQEKDGVKQ